MADQEHLDILSQGVKVWNQWREEHPDIRPDLGEADLRSATLRNANLHLTNLFYANLIDANLNEADLNNVVLVYANLRGADLRYADLSRAYLNEAHLDYADLRGADLTHAYLGNAGLHGADFGYTVLGDIDLSTVKGLEMVNHHGPSTIGIDTIYRSQGKIPEVFLKGAGVPNSFIDYMRSLIGKPIDYYSCFISYSSKDDAFARRLYADLQSHNVRCWFAPEDLKWGERIRTGIDEAIHFHDKLLLILSKSSVASGWVEREVKTALDKERKEKRTALFPIRVDNAIFECPFGWATEIRHERNIGDFTRWKNHDDYDTAFRRLLKDLKAEAMTG